VTERPAVAITMGDPAGIGAEVILKALRDDALRSGMRPLIVGDRAQLNSMLRELDARYALVEPGASQPGEVEVLDLPSAEPIVPGKATAAGGEAAWRYIEAAAGLCREGRADVLVTAPINKVALDLADRGRHGHTEILQEMTASPWSLTVFVLPDLRVLYLTRHLSLRDAIDAVTETRIVETLVRFNESCAPLGLNRPRIAVAALNPHAGEGGLFGTEEIDIIEPAVQQARALGLDVHGPIPADSVYFQARRGAYDVVLGLYHDQVASVTKTVDFDGTVSITLGLPFLRLSVDHGTAFDLVGQNAADATNMFHTLRTATEVAAADRVTASPSRR
jgi:4-hydroxythreonine-4-phosphate dehydrogenase